MTDPSSEESDAVVAPSGLEPENGVSSSEPPVDHKLEEEPTTLPPSSDPLNSNNHSNETSPPQKEEEEDELVPETQQFKNHSEVEEESTLPVESAVEKEEESPAMVSSEIDISATLDDLLSPPPDELEENAVSEEDDEEESTTMDVNSTETETTTAPETTEEEDSSEKETISIIPSSPLDSSPPEDENANETTTALEPEESDNTKIAEPEEAEIQQQPNQQQLDPPEEKTSSDSTEPKATTNSNNNTASNNNNNNNTDDEDDVTSKAAVALAAVAAAATANHKSPAEAAAQARAVAQTFLTHSHDDDDDDDDVDEGDMGVMGGDADTRDESGKKKKKKKESVWKRVRYRTVLQQLRAKIQSPHDSPSNQQEGGGGEATTTPTIVSDQIRHLIMGDNACFLQQLLLLEYFQCTTPEEEEEEDADDDDAGDHNSNKNNNNPPKIESRGDDPPEVKEHDKEQRTIKKQQDLAVASLAADRLISVLKKMEGAYDSLLNLLPHRHGAGGDRKNSFEANTSIMDDHHHPLPSLQIPDKEEDFETSVVVPDLLPPCTTAKGDSTLAFFRACTVREAPPQPAQQQQQQVLPRDTSSSTNMTTSTSLSSSTGLTETEAKLVAAHKAKSGGSNASSLSGRTAVSSMFGSMFKRNSSSSTDASPGKGSKTDKASASTTASAFLNSFRRRTKSTDPEEDGSNNANSKSVTDSTNANNSGTASGMEAGLRPGEYVVVIERDMLGLTVENVLERTVVRTLLAGGPAKKAGAKIGSLIVKVGNIETKNLTHFETIDELRQSQRPLLLVLKQLSEDSLRAAREEMGRLIRGAGFGTIMDGTNVSSQPASNNNSSLHRSSHEGGSSDNSGGGVVRPLIAADLRLDAFTSFLRKRLSSANATVNMNNKKEEGVARAADKLIWILTLFVFGLEREIQMLPASADDDSSRRASPQGQHHLYQHTLKEYTDSAKSAAKVLLDYTKKRIDPSANKANNNGNAPAAGFMTEQPRRRKGGPPPPPPPLPPRRRGKGRHQQENSNITHEKPLLQIGDVLQRTRTFMADTTSPPAALLRGEVIALLCDILDVDTEMELSEEEAGTATSGAQAGPINDLGSAGSLLKLIVLNCPIMRSPICEELSDSLAHSGDSEWAEELRRKLGTKEKYSSHELHRLHAGNRFLAVVHRLAASRSMSARITACSLGPVIWGHLDFPHQLQLRGVITRALHDVEVMVRKATANVLHEIAELVFDARCVPWLVLMSERSMTDPEPQMRSAAMTLTWHLAEHLPNTFLGDASQGSRYLRRLPDRNDPIFADVYLLQCKLLPVATRLAEDRSPSVRLAVAAQCDRLCDALGDHWSSVIIDVLLGLLSDPDERVRCEAVMCVPRLAGIVLLSSPPGASMSEVSILEALVPASIRLQGDSVAVVRVALASAAGELLTLLVALRSRTEEILSAAPDQNSPLAEGYRRYKKQVDERLIPLVQTLLNDQDPEVTSAALRAVTNASRRSSNVPHRHRHHSVGGDDDSASVTSLHSHASRENRQPVFMPVLSEIQVLRLLPTLSELADSKQWRVRQSAVEIVPALLGCTQKLETRTEISKLCVRLMSDKVDEVRKTAAECLCMGGSSLGSHGEDASSEWFQRIVIPTIRHCATHPNSKQRLLSLKMVEILLLNGACPSRPRMPDQSFEDLLSPPSSVPLSPVSELISIALSLCDDRIANVRLNVGRALESVLHVLSGNDLSSVVDGVDNQLSNEEANGRDRDVIFFATRCSTKAKSMKEEMGSEVSSSHLALL